MHPRTEVIQSGKVRNLDVTESLTYQGTAFVPSAATDEKSKVSSNDTTAGYLNGKLVAGTNITLTENNNGGNETLTISAAGGGGGEPGIGTVFVGNISPYTALFNTVVNNANKWIYVQGQQNFYKNGMLGYEYAGSFPTATQSNQYRLVFVSNGVAYVGNNASSFYYTSTNGTSWSTSVLENAGSGTFKFRSAQSSMMCRDFSNGDVYQFTPLTSQYMYKISGNTITRTTLPLSNQFESYLSNTITASNGVVSITKISGLTGARSRWYSSDFINWQEATLVAGQSSLSSMENDSFFAVSGTNTVWFKNNAGTTQYISFDSGVTYNQYTWPHNSTGHLEFSNGTYIYANNYGTIYTTTDFSTWTTISTGFGNNICSLFVEGNEVFALAHGTATSSLVYSANSGATWSSLTTNLPSQQQKFIRKVGSTYYMITRDANSGLNARMSLYSSTDRTNWTLIFTTYTTLSTTDSNYRQKYAENPSQYNFNWCMDVVNNNVVVVTGRSMHYYDGTSWTQESEAVAFISAAANGFFKVA